MGVTDKLHAAGQRSLRSSAALSGAAAYFVMFLAGLAEGVLGSFQYDRAVIGPVPAAALAFDAVILASCALGGWGLQAVPGALFPAIGWFVASFGLAMPRAGGSVIITATGPGEWYLYGGSLCALAGTGTALAVTLRGQPRTRVRG